MSDVKISFDMLSIGLPVKWKGLIDVYGVIIKLSKYFEFSVKWNNGRITNYRIIPIDWSTGEPMIEIDYIKLRDNKLDDILSK